MKKFKEYINEVKKPTGQLKDACWSGYTAVGMKMKGGRKVPNCVPEEVELEENHIAIAMGKMLDDEGSMILNQLDDIDRCSKMIREYVGKDYEKQMPAWVQSKVTLAADYINTVGTYLASKNEDVNEEVEIQEAYDADHFKYINSKEGNKHFEDGHTAMMHHIGDDFLKHNAKIHSKNVFKNNPHKKGTPEHKAWHHGADAAADEHIGSLDEAAKWRKTSIAKKVTDPDDSQDSHSYDYHYDNPRSKGMMKATSDTEPKYHSLSTRPAAQVASSGARKGMITKQHGERLKARIKSSLAKEEVEQIDEISQKTVTSYTAKAYKEYSDRLKNWPAKSAENMAKADKRWKGLTAAAKRGPKTHQVPAGKEPVDKSGRPYWGEDVEQVDESTPAWQRKEGKNPSGGLNAKGVASYRREHPGSTLKTAVTTKPSKLKPGSKAANRRKSFCARMSGMKKRLTSAKTAHDPNSRINKSLRKWNC